MADKGKFKPVSYKRAKRVTPAPRAAGSTRVDRIVSGGQAGVDRAALDFAIQNGIPHGGWCPAGRRAEDGEIGAAYAMHETPDAEYPQRTEWNVRDSDGTVIITIARGLTGGSALTRELALAHHKPCLHLARDTDGDNASSRLRKFVRREHIRVLNVAGPRAYTEPEAAAYAARVLEGLCG